MDIYSRVGNLSTVTLRPGGRKGPGIRPRRVTSRRRSSPCRNVRGTAALPQWRYRRRRSPGSVEERQGMHLEFSDEQRELRDSARSALARACPPRLVRQISAGEASGDELARELTWLGWPALTIDVDLGGLGRS